MKIEGKVHLNMNSYNSITIDNDIIRVKSNDIVKSNNNEFTNSLNGLSNGDIIYKVIRKFLNDNSICSISNDLKYKGRDYIVIKDSNNHSLKIYNCDGFYMNIFIDEYYSNLDKIYNNSLIDTYELGFSKNERNFYVKDNTCYINTSRYKSGNILNEDDIYIRALLNKHVNEDTYETYDNDKCYIITSDIKIIMNLDLYRRYVGYIELLKIDNRNKVLKLKKGNE